METPIVVKCVTCGMVLADKYMYYLEEVTKIKLNNVDDKNIKFTTDKVIYLTNNYKEKTIEGEILDKMGLNKMCCRRHMITKV